MWKPFLQDCLKSLQEKFPESTRVGEFVFLLNLHNFSLWYLSHFKWIHTLMNDFLFFFPIFTWHACIIHTHIEVMHLSQPSYILIQLNLNLLLAYFHANILIKYFKVTSLGNFLWLHPNCDNLKYIALEKKKRTSYQLKRHAKHHKTYNFLASTLIKAHGRHHQYHSLTLSTYGRLNILIEQSINILIKTPQIWLPVFVMLWKNGHLWNRWI